MEPQTPTPGGRQRAGHARPVRPDRLYDLQGSNPAPLTASRLSVVASRNTPNSTALQCAEQEAPLGVENSIRISSSQLGPQSFTFTPSVNRTSARDTSIQLAGSSRPGSRMQSVSWGFSLISVPGLTETGLHRHRKVTDTLTTH